GAWLPSGGGEPGTKPPLSPCQPMPAEHDGGFGKSPPRNPAAPGCAAVGGWHPAPMPDQPIENPQLGGFGNSAVRPPAPEPEPEPDPPDPPRPGSGIGKPPSRPPRPPPPPRPGNGSGRPGRSCADADDGASPAHIRPHETANTA